MLLLLRCRCLGIDLVPDPCAQLQPASLGYFGLWPTWRVVRALEMTRDTTGAGAGCTAFVQYWACAVAPQTVRSEGGGNDKRVHEIRVGGRESGLR